MRVVYKITCVENGKFYIGSTVRKTQRWARHRRELRRNVHKNKNMQASWNKYGEAAFLFEVIEEVATDVELMQAEQRWIDQNYGHPNCFNHNKFADAPWRGLSGPGTPMYGKTLSPESRAKLSAALAGDKHPRWGKAVSDDVKEKIRASNLAFPHKDYRHTPEAIAKIAAASLGRPVSEETRAKRSKALRGHEVSTLTRLKISESLSGENHPYYGKKRPEHGAKVRRRVAAIEPSGACTEYASIQELRETLGLKPPTVNRALKAGVPITKGKFEGWVFKYVAQQSN